MNVTIRQVLTELAPASPEELKLLKLRYTQVGKPQENMEEELPPELHHTTLEDFLISMSRARSWMTPSKSKLTRPLSLHLGSQPCLLHVPMSQWTNICFVCQRPLSLYKLSIVDPETGNGRCPEHMLRRAWELDAEREENQSQRDQTKFDRSLFLLKKRSDFIARWVASEKAQWKALIQSSRVPSSSLPTPSTS